MKEVLLGGVAALSAVALISTFMVSIPDPEWQTRTLNPDHGKFVAAESFGPGVQLFYTNSSEGGVIAETAKTSGFINSINRYFKEGRWDRTVVDSRENTGAYLSATSTSDRLFLAYQDDSVGDEKVIMASSEGNGWNTTTVDEVSRSGVNVGMHTSLTTYNGKPFVLYHSPRRGLITALKTVNGWERNVRGENLGWLTSSDSCGDKVYAAYIGRHSDRLRISEYGANWESRNTSEKIRSSVDVEVRDCKPHIVFLDKSSETVKYLSPRGETTELADADYTRTSIIADQKIHVAFQNYGEGLYHAVKTGEDWNMTAVDSSSGAGRYNDIEIDNAGNIHIIYSDGEVVKHTYLNKGTIKAVETGLTGLRTALALVVLLPSVLLRTEILRVIELAIRKAGSLR